MRISLSATAKVVLLTVFIGFFTTPQLTYAGHGNGHGNGNGNGNNGNGNGNGGDDGDNGDDGAGGDAVPISGLSVLLVAGVAYTAIKVYNSKKVKASVI